MGIIGAHELSLSLIGLTLQEVNNISTFLWQQHKTNTQPTIDLDACLIDAVMRTLIEINKNNRNNHMSHNNSTINDKSSCNNLTTSLSKNVTKDATSKIVSWKEERWQHQHHCCYHSYLCYKTTVSSSINYKSITKNDNNMDAIVIHAIISMSHTVTKTASSKKELL